MEQEKKRDQPARREDPEQEQGKQPFPESHRRRLNPRLVLASPTVFFHDLLMEEQEQG